MKLLAGEAYLQALLSDIASAKRSITLATMVIDTEPPMDQLIQALITARQQDVTIKLYIDTFTTLLFHDGIDPKSFAIHKRMRRALESLSQTGVEIIWLGKIGLNPYRQRFHQKFSIIDEKVVYLGGGINLAGGSFGFHDYMFRTENTTLTQTLLAQLKAIEQNGSINDSEYAINADTTLLLDGGKAHHSIIYDKAIELASQAQSIIFISQMSPYGALASVLKQKSVTYYFNSPQAMKLPSSIAEYITQKQQKYENSYKGTRYIHAKCMLFTLPGGSHTVLTGSHNFNQRGVNYGTKEIALLSKDEKTYQELLAFSKTLS